VKKKVLLKSPILTRSGYGEHSRFIFKALMSRKELFDIYVVPLNWGQTSWIVESDDERKLIDEAILNTSKYLADFNNNPANEGKQPFDLSLQVTIPNEWERIAHKNIGVTAGIETTKVAPAWIEKSQIMDLILVPSKHSRAVYNNTVYNATNTLTNETKLFKNETPIEVLPYSTRKYKPAKVDVDFDTDFNFFTVSQWSPRKNIENTVKWFIEEFYDNPNVGFVIKTNLAKNCLMDRELCYKRIQALLSEYDERECKIYLLHGHMTDEELAALYVHPKIKSFITLTHGEGFGLPIFEAVCQGLPVIAPAWSGHCDFLWAPTKTKNSKNKLRPHFIKVDYDLETVPENVVWEGVIQKDSMWCNARQGASKMSMRNMYKNYERHKSTAKKLQKYIVKEFAAEKLYKEFINYLEVDNIDASSDDIVIV
tara:strand:+ start:40925 stop:42199 length:1275 start_codon:yes stop_codon:yes gene_type:complete